MKRRMVPFQRLIIMVRAYTGCSLKEARSFVEDYPHLVKAEAKRRGWTRDPPIRDWIDRGFPVVRVRR